jgi:hypothetical protein
VPGAGEPATPRSSSRPARSTAACAVPGCHPRMRLLRHPVRVAKGLIAVALLTAVAALAIAIAALREARQANGPTTYAEITAAGVCEFQAAGNQMTPAQVLRLLGKPVASTATIRVRSAGATQRRTSSRCAGGPNDGKVDRASHSAPELRLKQVTQGGAIWRGVCPLGACYCGHRTRPHVGHRCAHSRPRARVFALSRPRSGVLQRIRASRSASSSQFVAARITSSRAGMPTGKTVLSNASRSIPLSGPDRVKRLSAD